MDSLKETPKEKASKSQKNIGSRTNSKKITNTPHKKPIEKVQEVSSSTSCSSDDEDELCFICTEPVVTYAVAQCDHRTCHRCTLRLRALYETRNCAYCKAEQKVVLFTKDPEKPFEDYDQQQDTPFTDKKLGIKFETQEMYKEAMQMMEYNCPKKDCTETSKNWGELKQHVRKSHSLNICDLCSRHKKIFPYEHTLYTSAQLTKHHREGDKEFIQDDETGFSGHPECAFCKTRFYGDDELFIHCRDMHEQCFLCVRNGNRHEYYANYASLEEHFKTDHCMCLYPQCLEKKFVVFDSSIDLKAHEVDVHGESVAGLQRSMQAQSKQLELNFQYESFRQQQQHHRSNTSSSNNRKGKKKDESNTNSPKNGTSTPNNGSSSGNTSQADFPSMNSVNEALPTTKRIIPGASTKTKGKGKALQKPAGFGTLSTPVVANEQTTTNKPTTNTNVDESVAFNHATFLSRVGDILKSKAKVAEFRSLTGAYRKSQITCEEYVNQIVVLTSSHIENSNKIFKGVENLLDMEDKKWELIRVWRDKHTAMSHFPALDVKKKTQAPQSSRVLVIKPKQTRKVVGGSTNNTKKKNVWDKVESAATVATATSSSRPTSAHSSARSSPQTSRPSSPSNTYRASTVQSKTPWSGSAGSSSGSGGNTQQNKFPALESKPFPALPSAAPKHQMILNMRRTASGQNLVNNAWGGSSSYEEDTPSSVETTTNKKKKGRKNNMLFRVGL